MPDNHCCCTPDPCAVFLDRWNSGGFSVSATFSGAVEAGGFNIVGDCGQFNRTMALVFKSPYLQTVNACSCSPNNSSVLPVGFAAYLGNFCFSSATTCSVGGPPSADWGMVNFMVAASCVSGQLSISAGIVGSDSSHMPGGGGTFPLFGDGTGTYAFHCNLSLFFCSGSATSEMAVTVS